MLIPNPMRNEILNKIHSSHLGIEKSTQEPKHVCTGQELMRTSKKSSKYALHAKNILLNKKETMIPHEIPSRSWKVIGSDSFHVAGETPACGRLPFQASIFKKNTRVNRLYVL